MTPNDWFRRATWTDRDRQEFDVRLKRCRSPRIVAQYMRIQAHHLAEAGQDGASAALLDRLFAECPDKSQLAQAHAQKAAILARRNEIDGAIQEYRAALQAEREFPNLHTNAWLEFGWLLVNHDLSEYYDEALRTLREFRDEDGLQLPAIEFRYLAIQALIADSRGEGDRASELARDALREAARVQSGVSRHPDVGLVGSVPEMVKDRLKSLAAAADG